MLLCLILEVTNMPSSAAEVTPGQKITYAGSAMDILHLPEGQQFTCSKDSQHGTWKAPLRRGLNSWRNEGSEAQRYYSGYHWCRAVRKWGTERMARSGCGRSIQARSSQNGRDHAVTVKSVIFSHETHIS